MDITRVTESQMIWQGQSFETEDLVAGVELSYRALSQLEFELMFPLTAIRQRAWDAQFNCVREVFGS